MRVSVFLLLVFSSLPSFAAAGVDAPLTASIRIENYGLYQLLDKSDQSFNPESTAGYESVINTRFIEKTDVIALKKNRVFGFNYAINDPNTAEEWVVVDIKISHPLTTNFLGHQSTGFSRQSAARLKADGRYHNGAFYVFTEDYEMVPGLWVVSVIYRGEFVARQSFSITAD
ncbi:DUF3859 domain-containing protein [Oceanicoccus sagamiensis]|nr:DUF3859 domain-containing protein [Oceanicoccus sagamiensis]